MDTKYIFLDTCAIDELVRRGISSASFIKILGNKYPVVSPYIIREIEKTLATDNPKKAFYLVSFLKDLNPKYSYHRYELYMLEVRKLRLGTPVEPFLYQERKAAILQRIENLSNGIVEPGIQYIIKKHQSLIDEARRNWTQKQDDKYKKYRNNFDSLRNDAFENLKTNSDKIDSVRKLIQHATLDQCILINNEIIELCENIADYPALRSLIYTNIYLNFLTETNPNTPSEDKFTDALILIEASYCNYFLSADYKLVHRHAKYINPHINRIYLDDFLKEQAEEVKRQKITEIS